MGRFVTIGETMAVFVPENYKSIRYGAACEMYIAGAESNTAIGLQKLGHNTQLITRIGNDSMGEYLLRGLKAESVGTDYIITDPNYPTGIMFKERAAHQNTAVLYYRENSAASKMTSADIPFDIIKSADILHITGITPLLSISCREMVWTALNTALENGVKISFDPNIRKKLWKDQDHRKLMKEIIKKSSYVMLGVDEAKILYGTEDVQQLASIMSSEDKIVKIAIKNGSNGAWVCDYKEQIYIPPVHCSCIDPVGAGDAFNAGFLAGILEDKELNICGSMGALAGAMATETFGDYEGVPNKTKMNQILNNIETVYR